LKHQFEPTFTYNTLQTPHTQTHETITMFRQQITRQARLFSTSPIARKSPVETIKDAAKAVDRTISGAAVKGIEKGGTSYTTLHPQPHSRLHHTFPLPPHTPIKVRLHALTHYNRGSRRGRQASRSRDKGRGEGSGQRDCGPGEGQGE